MIKNMERVNITVVGAGAIGLAIGWELSKLHKDILVIEKNSSFGQETSSRNSEVVHSGIYYPKDSLKARTCVEGRELIYRFCEENKIAHRKMGKLIVAIDKSEVKDLEELLRRGLENGVDDIKIVSRNEIKALEPNVEAEAAIYSSFTGILDSHSFMKNLLLQFEARGGTIAYNTELIAIEKTREGYELTAEGRAKESFKFSTKILINSAGLNSDNVAQMAGIKEKDYKLKYCKGSYFRVRNDKAQFIDRLIYPVPIKEKAVLGIHATLDLAGGLRLGPDDEYVNKIDYSVDEAKKAIFYESVRRSLPFIEREDLTPDVAGIRPRLQGPSEAARDFIIKEESEKGLPGLVNLIGIESPGLTGSLSIAKLIAKEQLHF